MFAARERSPHGSRTEMLAKDTLFLSASKVRTHNLYIVRQCKFIVYLFHTDIGIMYFNVS